MKKTYIALGVIVLASALGYALVYMRTTSNKVTCPTDVMMCPDGSSVERIGQMCEFDVCAQELPSYMKSDSDAVATVVKEEATSSIPFSSSVTSKKTSPKPATTLFGKISQSISSVVRTGTEFVQTGISTGLKETSTLPPTLSTAQSSTNSNQTIPTGTSNTTIDDTRYAVVDGAIVNSDNTVIYTLPASVSVESSSSTENWETHIVNVVPINEIPPVVGGIPVEGTTGKYYLSENSFGNIENCEFSNKIYILDTTTGQRTLLYEENSSTLSKDDARACNSEMYLLATDQEKLILKYHTINTNMVCESTWSEPEKTWYLDVTSIQNGTKRFVISNSLYLQAEDEESTCRLNLETAQQASTEN